MAATSTSSTRAPPCTARRHRLRAPATPRAKPDVTEGTLPPTPVSSEHHAPQGQRLHRHHRLGRRRVRPVGIDSEHPPHPARNPTRPAPRCHRLPSSASTTGNEDGDYIDIIDHGTAVRHTRTSTASHSTSSPPTREPVHRYPASPPSVRPGESTDESAPDGHPTHLSSGSQKEPADTAR